MKTTNSRAHLASLAITLTYFPLTFALAADTNSTPNAAPIAVQAPADASIQTAVAAHKLPYGVEDVLKLSRAHVGDDIVVNYIRNTGTIYALSPQDVVYVRTQGVSDRVINTMIDQRKVVTAENPPAQARAIPNVSQAPVTPYYTQVAPVYTGPRRLRLPPLLMTRPRLLTLTPIPITAITAITPIITAELSFPSATATTAPAATMVTTMVMAAITAMAAATAATVMAAATRADTVKQTRHRRE
jgi:hypothetical protein